MHCEKKNTYTFTYGWKCEHNGTNVLNMKLIYILTNRSKGPS